ncbi:hypothetical protein [Bacillus sp. E214]|uniref:hypothetical protein n=1 Tax=Bacillus sp. E214 TaxID=2587156 RepID=UPI00165263D2|nr:hypothetical protein [Bacillus sp. E214]
MKSITMLLLTIFTVLVLVFGQNYWSSQIAKTVAMENEKEQAEPKKRGEDLFTF